MPYDDIGKILIINPEIPPDSLTGKFSRLDLSMEYRGKLINIEIQVKNEPNYRDRALYYWAKLYNSPLKSGEDYSELKRTITINIVDFNIFTEENFHNEFIISNKQTGIPYSDKLNMHFFELHKLSKKIDPHNGMELWMQFINAQSEEDFEMINQTNIPIMQKAVNIVYDMSEDARIREMVRMREKALHDEANAMNGAWKDGYGEGIVADRERAIKVLKSLGMSDEDIAKVYPPKKDD
ncbi:MAG: Rpn family recombination-promoting nuclease/putative transposase [Ruminococcus sp.]|nr:Rpn family recombination-promoting nuclease/putative transposase [Ruminococcus sp.]